MAKEAITSQADNLPIEAALLIGLLSALVVGACFAVIKYWPLPVSVAPYMGFRGGFCWGAIVGGLSGWVIGFLTDETHFSDQQ